MLREMDRKGTANGLAASLLLLAAIYFGSGQLRHFDPALIAYTSATVFAVFGIVYRYSVWLQRPPTEMYWRRGWQFFLRPAQLPKNLLMLARLFWNTIFLQTFIKRRSHLRWAAHLLLSWGTIAACMVTFPLVFGWIHFEADPQDPAAYQAFAFGFHAGTFPAESPIGWFTFHILDFCAVAVIVGMALAMRRRVSDPGATSVQQFSMDFVPIILLFSVSVTGLMLTASVTWMEGHNYSFLALLHAFSVIITLLYLPFGKFFHIFQRPANLGVRFYKEEALRTEQAACARCGVAFASRLQIEDLKTVEEQLGMSWQYADGTHYQDICPTCRRKMLGANQLEAIGGPGYL